MSMNEVTKQYGEHDLSGRIVVIYLDVLVGKLSTQWVIKSSLPKAVAIALNTRDRPCQCTIGCREARTSI